MWQEIATFPAFAFDANGIYSNNKTFFIPNGDLFLLGVMGSTSSWFFLKQVAVKMVGGALAMQAIFVSQLPIPHATPAEQAAIAALVEQILAAKAATPPTDTTALEAEIDRRVAALYGLTPEEAARLG